MSYVTLPYPFRLVEAPPEYRGRPQIDPELCIGCGACSRACPPDAITVEDVHDDGIRRIKVNIARCIRCARCEEVCPTGAMKLTQDFELANTSKDLLVQVVELELARCSICGKPTGYTRRQVEKAKEILRHLPEDLMDEFISKMTLCKDCRRNKTIEHLLEVYPGLSLFME